MKEIIPENKRWKFIIYIFMSVYVIFIGICMHHFIKMMEFIQQVPVQISRETREMKTRVLEMQNTMPGLLATPSLTFNDIEKILQIQEKAQDASYAVIASLLPKKDAKLLAVKDAMTKIRVLRREYAHQLIGNADYNQAMALFKKMIEPQVSVVYDALNSLFIDSESQTKNIQKEMKRNMYIAILLSVLIGATITLALVYADKREAKRIREIENREKLFNRLSENVDDLFIIASTSKSFNYVSPNSLRLIGIPSEKIIEDPDNLYEMLTENVKDWFHHALKKKNSCSFSDEIDFCLQENNKYYRLYISPLSGNENNKDEEKYLIVLSDQTKAHMQRHALEEALDAANLASKAKSNFLSHMSHEIRTPMNAIIGMTTIALSKIGDLERVADCLHKISDSSKHLLGLINDVLDMSKIESGKLAINKEIFNLNRNIQNIKNLVRPQTKQKNQTFEILLENVDQEDLVGDGLRLNQILLNILSNSIKFTPADGSIYLKIRQTPPRQNRVNFFFIIEDTGIGMSQEFLKKIYMPFEQASVSTASKYGGTGLGMAITYNLVKLMGGTINVESVEGKGTTFTIELPFGLAGYAVSQRNSLPPLKILVVDDDNGTCEHASLLLEKMGAKVNTCLNGFDAIKLIKEAEEESHGYDVCLIDWKMPDMDGAETAQRIRATVGKDMLIIIISAYDWKPIEDQARSVGVNDFIAKPFFSSSLYDTLLNVTHRQNEKIETSGGEKERYDFIGKRILLVEDNEFNREIGQEFLEMANIEVEIALNGKEALDMFLANPPGYYDMILMDVQMPVMDGHEATRKIRASAHPTAKTIPIIAMTANAFSEDVSLAEKAGMNGHLAKPIDIKKLYLTLSNFLTKVSKSKV